MNAPSSSPNSPGQTPSPAPASPNLQRAPTQEGEYGGITGPVFKSLENPFLFARNRIIDARDLVEGSTAFIGNNVIAPTRNAISGVVDLGKNTLQYTGSAIGSTASFISQKAQNTLAFGGNIGVAALNAPGLLQARNIAGRAIDPALQLSYNTALTGASAIALLPALAADGVRSSVHLSRTALGKTLGFITRNPYQAPEFSTISGRIMAKTRSFYSDFSRSIFGGRKEAFAYV